MGVQVGAYFACKDWAYRMREIMVKLGTEKACSRVLLGLSNGDLLGSVRVW